MSSLYVTYSPSKVRSSREYRIWISSILGAGVRHIGSRCAWVMRQIEYTGVSSLYEVHYVLLCILLLLILVRYFIANDWPASNKTCWE